MKRSVKVFFSMAVALIMLIGCISFAAADNIVETIMNAGTTQAFSDEPVAAEDLETILRAGLAAPSAINQQPWFFAAVTNREIMTEIAGSGSGFGFAPPSGNGEKDAPAGMPEGFSGEKPDGAPGNMPSPGSGGFTGGSGSAKASLGDSPAAIIIYMNGNTFSPNANFDCGLAAQNMYIAAVSLGYGAKIVSSPTMSLNGADHDALCEKLGVPSSMQAVAVILIGKPDGNVDAVSGATTRDAFESKVSMTD